MRMPVSICGELAAAHKVTPLLLGLGVRSLSMNASAVPKVKQVIRSVEIDACVRFARRVMEQADPERIRAMLDGFGRGEG
jgi:phosphoenolpyruvate-protein kinase (PTS system EI component)